MANDPQTDPDNPSHNPLTDDRPDDAGRPYDNGAAPRSAAAEGETAGTATTLGSEFDSLRRQGAAGAEGSSGTTGRSLGQGRAGFNGDEDRGYDESGYRGGLGTSGGREDLADRQERLTRERNPFRGGYSGGDPATPDQAPADDLRQHLGLNTPNPTADDPQTPHPDDRPTADSGGRA